MEKQNVCNFNFNRSGDLICDNFVCEKNDGQAEAVRAKCYEIMLVTKGEGIFTCEKREYRIAEGSLFFVLRGEIFSVRSVDGLEYCYICYRGRRADELMERICIKEDGRIYEGRSELVTFWLHNLSMVNNGNVDLLSEATLLYSLAGLEPDSSEQGDLVSQMVAVTNDNFTDQEFNLFKLAITIGYDEKYISAAFKKQKGVTYSSYLRRLRISHAIFLMEQGLVSVKNIAYLSGFGDPLYFSKVFKQSEGVTPKDYIRQIEERGSSK